ncbi:MAG: hypothetical protein KDB27_22205 [Planctomycetales bacterium]|nr:hypothetical protein [Planctomycetales bacterium]
MSSFDERLSKAIERGSRRADERARAERQKALSAEELKSLHTRYRLQLSEHIESCVKQLPNHFPGFQFEILFGDKGWGAACNRDDIGPGREGRRANYFSRFEMTIRPHSELNVVDLAAKGTIRNKEVINRNHYERIQDADLETFRELIDVWVLEYAELFAAKS